MGLRGRELNRICGGNFQWTNILSKLQRMTVPSLLALWTLSQTQYSLVLYYLSKIYYDYSVPFFSINLP